MKIIPGGLLQRCALAGCPRQASVRLRDGRAICAHHAVTFQRASRRLTGYTDQQREEQNYFEDLVDRELWEERKEKES